MTSYSKSVMSNGPRGKEKITNLDQAVDKKKYDENFDRIFGRKCPNCKQIKRPYEGHEFPEHEGGGYFCEPPSEGDTFVEGSAEDKYQAGYDETFGAK